MPIYEYACTSCGHRLEAIQKLNDAPLMDCPECGKPALQKQVTAAGFRLAGGGWYETDFKGGGKRNVKESESAAKPAESKPAPCGAASCSCPAAGSGQ